MCGAVVGGVVRRVVGGVEGRVVGGTVARVVGGTVIRAVVVVAAARVVEVARDVEVGAARRADDDVEDVDGEMVGTVVLPPAVKVRWCPDAHPLVPTATATAAAPRTTIRFRTPHLRATGPAGLQRDCQLGHRPHPHLRRPSRRGKVNARHSPGRN